MNSTSSYRPDIDGLRAIAVLSVILFHFAPGTISGGYLGVDIFFVLSGYLITRIVHNEILAGNFSLRGFYERRIRRIVPALLVVLVCSSIVAALILLPADLVKFAKALLATLVFIPNVFAWRDTNYFSPHADQKPLLHTWSLGVEEQFYLFFPIMLMLLMRNSRRLTLPVVIGIACASFALHVLAVRFTSGAFAFYLLPTRAWELGAGAIIALAPRGNESGGPVPWVSTLAGALGLGLIACALLSPWEYRAPVSHAAIAVAGTALLLGIGQNHHNPVSRTLGAKPLAWIGQISYSLYLWHWPVIVFSKYYLVRELRPLDGVVAGVFMFGAAAISWRFVERPFRRREFPARRLYLGSAAASIALAAFALVFIQSRGLPARLSPETALMSAAVGTHFHCDGHDIILVRSTRMCVLNPAARDPADARLALFGNSHAQMYAPVWREILEQRGEAGLLVSMSGCLPTIVVNYNVECLRLARTTLDTMNELPNIRTVVLALTWFRGDDLLVDSTGRRLDDHDIGALIAALDDLISRIRERGRRVVLIGPIAIPGWNLASEVSRKLAFGRPVDRPLALPRPEFEHQYAAVFNHFSGRQDVTLVRPDLIQCNAESCPYVIDGRPLFSDENHLAAAEVGAFREIFTAALE
jgi:peptidoglycan/LPS O-acetylase OafA/YrhL